MHRQFPSKAVNSVDIPHSHFKDEKTEVQNSLMAVLGYTARPYSHLATASSPFTAENGYDGAETGKPQRKGWGGRKGLENEKEAAG